MKKILARIGISKKLCSNCQHFDLEAGQQGIRTSSPAFVAAAQVLTPEQISMTAMTDEERDAERAHILAAEEAINAGKTPPPMPEILVALSERIKAAPEKAVPWKLTEFGACAKNPTEAVWINYTCGDWA